MSSKDYKYGALAESSTPPENSAILDSDNQNNDKFDGEIDIHKQILKESKSDVTEAEYGTTPYRWVILLTFCGLSLNLAMCTVGFASYLGQIKLAYGIGKYTAIFFITMPTLLYAPVNFVSAWFHKHFAINKVLYIAASF